MRALRSTNAPARGAFSVITGWYAGYQSTPRVRPIGRLVVLVGVGIAIVGASLAAVVIVVMLRLHGHG